jgi:hypothetical protein
MFSPRPDVNGGYWFRTPWITGAGKDYVNYNEINYNNATGYFFDFTSLGYPFANGYVGVPISASYDAIKSRAVYQFGAGDNYWDSLLNKISFPEIYRIFSEDSTFINYTKSTWDSVNQSTIVTDNSFVLEFIKPSSFVQSARKLTVEEDYKPESIKDLLVLGISYLFCIDILAIWFPQVYTKFGYPVEDFSVEDDDWEPSLSTIPFGPYLAIGALVCILFKTDLLDKWTEYLRTMQGPAFLP